MYLMQTFFCKTPSIKYSKFISYIKIRKFYNLKFFEYIEKMRQHKVLLKKNKCATLTHIENQLLNETKIDIHTFFSLCLIENINIFYIHKKTFYESSMDPNNAKTFILYRLDNPIRYTFEIASTDLLEKYRKDFFQIENFIKPLKTHSSYKLQELIDFCKKLGIQTQKIEKEKSDKTKNKKELYESLVQYF